MTTPLALLMCLIVAAQTYAQSEITLSDARRLVEAYVSQQGYTDATTSLKPEELDGSSFERQPRSEWLSLRHGMIQPRAVAYTSQVRGEAPGWTFGFAYKLPQNAPEFQRRYSDEHYFSVQTTKVGKDIVVLHSSLPKKLFQPLDG
jgi:hypothetical protein